MLAARSMRRVWSALIAGTLLLGLVGATPVAAVGLTWTVTTTDDLPEVNPAVVLCTTANGECSLRAAVMQANAFPPGTDLHKIVLPAGVFTLDIEGQDENNAATGDLDVKVNLRIEGAGAGQTIIQASTTTAQAGIDRILELRSLGITFELADVTLRRANSHGDPGTGIHVSSAGADVTVDRVVMTDLYTFDSTGAGIFSRGPLVVRDSRFSNIETDGGPVIEKQGSTFAIRRSTFSNNYTYNGPVGIYGDASGIIERSTFNGNTNSGPLSASAISVGRHNDDPGELILRNSTIAGNIGQAGTIVAYKSTFVSIESSTIAGNDDYGIDPRENTEIRNTLLANNSRGNCVDKPSSQGNNLDSGNTCLLDAPDDIQNGVADLVKLADNGGPTRTRALGSDSEAIDAGSNCPAMDQRGVTRKDGDGNGSVVCDIGAYEAPTGHALATPEPTATPTDAPTAAPTAPPTAAPTEAPPSEAPSLPAASGAPSAEPVASPGATTDASTPGGAPSAVATPAPTPVAAPATGEPGSTGLIVIGLAIALIVLLAGFILAMRRRRPSPSG